MSKTDAKNFIIKHFPEHAGHVDKISGVHSLAKLTPTTRVVCGCGAVLEKTDQELATVA
jgi:hypothetical protein